MNVDVIILAKTSNLELYGMTQRTIQSLWLSERNYNFHINIVESNPNYLDQGFIYNNCTVITPTSEFGYNKFLNHGLRRCNHDWVIIANNDLIFTQEWFTDMMKWRIDNPGIYSLSPWEPNWHLKRGLDPNHGPYFGYRPAFEITGWCLVMTRDLIEKCELFDPDFEYWYQDNDYALTLQKHGYKHVLLPQSRVYHMVSGTLHELDPNKKEHMTDGQINVLRRKWGPNV